MNNKQKATSTLDRFHLDGKVALVTGGSHGIGKAIALSLAEAGADVIIAARNLSDLQKTAQEISKKTGRKVLPVSANICNLPEIDTLVSKSMEEFSHINVLVNNAGGSLGTFGPAFNITEEKWDLLFATNLKGAFFLSLAVGKMMRDKGGCTIVNVASDVGLRPEAGLSGYSVAKAGVVMLTRVLALEWSQYNIRVNAICPGLIKTRLTEYHWVEHPHLLKEVGEFKLVGTLGSAPGEPPIAGIGRPEDIASVALFLASDASAFMTGEILLVNGQDTVSSRTTIREICSI